jgi:hypothetical protein
METIKKEKEIFIGTVLPEWIKTGKEREQTEFVPLN